MNCCLIWRLVIQRQRVSALFLKTLLGVLNRVVCLQKDHFWFGLVAAMFVYNHNMLWLYTDWMVWRASELIKWIKNKAVPWVWLVFKAKWGVKRNLYPSILYWKIWILKMRAPQAKIFWIFEILHFKMRKLMESELTSSYEM